MVGLDVAISINPTLSAEPVRRYTRMDAASVVSALPIEEINCPSQSNVNERLRKTENIEGADFPAMFRSVGFYQFKCARRQSQWMKDFMFSIGVIGTRSHPGQMPSTPAAFAPRTASVS